MTPEHATAHRADAIGDHPRIGGSARAARTAPGRLRLVPATAHLARRRVQPRIASRETHLRLRRARRMSLMSQGGLYNEGAVAPPREPDARTASSEVWAQHTPGPNCREHVTTTEEAVAVALIAGSRVAWQAIPALIRWYAIRASVADKLTRYLLNPAHPTGGAKAEWFKQALGFTQANLRSRSCSTGARQFKLELPSLARSTIK